MPKQHLARAVDVAHLFAAQGAALNISLSAIGLLWHITDALGRSAAAAAAAAAAAPPPQGLAGGALGGAIGGLLSMLARRPSVEEAVAARSATAVAAAAADSAPVAVNAAEAATDPHLTLRSDLGEEESTELLLRVLTHLRQLSMDPRPEV